ncbi:MAG: APC family permease [Bryobacteraceae bacterium]
MINLKPKPPSSVLTPQIGLLPALSTNVLNMVGIGPFVTIPLVIGAMGGPQAIMGWAAGALIALCDGLVWAELGAALPHAGGSYRYLREAYGPATWGRFMSFLFLGQTIISAPLTAASGGVGFAEYATYLLPSLSYWQARAIAIAVCLLATFLLYRNIRAIGQVSMVLTAALVATMGWIILAGATHFQARLAFDFPPAAFHLSREFFLGLGSATLLAMYDYSGYFNVCLIGAEVKNPSRNIPRCILLSIVLLGFCYAAMSVSIIGVLPWREVAQSRAVVSDFVQRISGPGAARLMTILILVAAFGSVYSVLLGYSRVPYAAAIDGQFFSVFARVHRTKRFPSFSVLAMGIASAVACLLSLGALIKSLIVLQILTQFMAQCVGVILIRRYRPDIPRPFSMWLYPLPTAIALLGWIFILTSSGIPYVVAGLASVAFGFAVFLAWTRRCREWPFKAT